MTWKQNPEETIPLKTKKYIAILAALTVLHSTAQVKTKIEYYGPDVVRVIKGSPNQNFSVIEQPHKGGPALKVRVDSATGAVSFYAPDGRLLMAENSAALFSGGAAQAFSIPDTQAIYGLGQHQEGILNYSNHTVTLRQRNMDIGIPFFQTSGGYGVLWNNASTTTFKDADGTAAFTSAVGDGVDYYFIYGGDAEHVVARLRKLTGAAPMFPRWVFGYWQSRERYKSQWEITDVVRHYRALNVPLDAVVQDWQYWGTNDSVWNAVRFGNPLYPDPKGMIDTVHALHAHLMISVWPSFGPATAIHKEIALYPFKTWPGTPGVQVYDAFNPQARDVYWKYMNRNIFSKGMDAWWLDATEPEQPDTAQSNKSHTYAGSFASVCNAFPLMTTGGVYTHQRETTDRKRVVILTRSAFTGQQRNAAAVWSGDIQGTWDVFRKQIAGGLSLSLCGIPYWNTDIGGFYSGVRYPGGVNDPAYRELYTRWLEFATFTPLFRSHGTNTPREIWQFGKAGEPVYETLKKFINLRYRLLPYIYSTAWQVTSAGSTMMRALVMDFPGDRNVYDIRDEYLFGRSILVAPVTDTTGARKVYLPKGAGWFDFWTDKVCAGTPVCETPIDRIPLFVRSGSILPLGPYEQYATEKRTDTLDIKIYGGASGRFTLYEDENDNYNYEKGRYSTITFRWDDQAGTLSIDDRKGAFTGMAQNRVFRLILAGTGLQKTIAYAGKAIKQKLSSR